VPLLALEKTDRPGYRPYRATVVGVRQLSPSFVRVTFASDAFDTFGTDCLDQRIKIVFPLPDGTFSDLGADSEDAMLAGDWYDRWRSLPDHLRNPFRTYTVRAIDQDARLLDVDFVSHGDGGPAARWLAEAAPGAEVIVVGPDARSIHCGTGIDWRPGDASDLLLVGDETAAPAISAILETLPAGRRAHAYIEVPDARDSLALSHPAGCTVTWLDRAGGDNGCRLIPAVQDWLAAHPETVAGASATREQRLDDVDIDVETLWESPEQAPSGFYAWIAGESSTVKTLRRMLVTGSGIDRSRVAFMGYWRLGKAES